jgi:hypothetical protein
MHGEPLPHSSINRSFSFLLIVPLWVGIINYESTLGGDKLHYESTPGGDKIITNPLWVGITLNDDYNYNYKRHYNKTLNVPYPVILGGLRLWLFLPRQPQYRYWPGQGEH